MKNCYIYIHIKTIPLRGGGVIAKLLLVGIFLSPLSESHAYLRDPLTDIYTKLECVSQGNNCKIKTQEGTLSQRYNDSVYYKIKYNFDNKYDFNHNGNISGIAFKTPDSIDPSKNYILNFIGNFEHLIDFSENYARPPKDKLNKLLKITPNRINITTTGTTDFTFAQIKDISNVKYDFIEPNQSSERHINGSVYLTWGDMIKINNEKNKDVDLRISRYTK